MGSWAAVGNPVAEDGSWGGDAWSEVGPWGKTGSSPYVVALAIDPQTPTTVYAGMLGICGMYVCALPMGLFKSTDGGATWGNTDLGSVHALAIDPISPSRLYAGTGGVFAIGQVAPTPTPTVPPTATPTVTPAPQPSDDGGGGCTVTLDHSSGAAWWPLVPALVLAWAQRRQRG